MAKMYASEIVKLAKSWVGLKESDGSYKKIIDIYNSIEHERGAMSYSWEWCAATTSALVIELGYTERIPVEMSCNRLIEKAKTMGIWVERDDYVPNPGDFCLYDWNDNGVGDCKGEADHIGTVTKSENGKFVVVEGNYNEAVRERTMKVNGRYIRGFIAPKYDPEPIGEKALPVKHSVDYRHFFRCTSNLVLRTGPSAKHRKLELMQKGCEVTCWGVHAVNGNTIWLLVAAESGLTGWCSSKYLEKM